MWGHMGNYSWDGGGWFTMGIGMIGVSLFWILLIVAIVLLVKGLGSGSETGRLREKQPLDILKERYARGEIDKEEFEQKKRDLQEG